MKLPGFKDGLLLFLVGITLIFVVYMSTHCYATCVSQTLFPPAGQLLTAEPEFSFAVMGDSASKDACASNVLRYICQDEPEFILHLGDQAESMSPQHFEWLVKKIRDEIDTLPFYAIPGNHDITDRHSPNDPTRFRYYKRAFGQPYYWFGYGETLFVGMDTSCNTIGLEQQQWLSQIMEQIRPMFTSCIIYMHIPPKDPRTQNPLYDPQSFEFFHSLVQDNDIAAILCGHMHEFLKDEFAGTPLYVVPPSGQTMRGDTTHYGYFYCTLTAKNELKIDCRSIDTDPNYKNHAEFYFSSHLFKTPVFTAGTSCIILGAFIMVQRKGRHQRPTRVKSEQHDAAA